MTDSSRTNKLLLLDDNKSVEIAELSETAAFIKLLQKLQNLKGETNAVDSTEALMDAVSELTNTTTIYEQSGRIDPLSTKLQFNTGNFGGRICLTIDDIDPETAPTTLDGLSIEKTFFRRAEGLQFRLDSAVDAVLLSRMKWDDSIQSSKKLEYSIPRQAFFLLSVLSNWQGVDACAKYLEKDENWVKSWLLVFCESQLVWYADKPYARTLPGADPRKTEASHLVLLNPSCATFPLVRDKIQPDAVAEPLSFMPRMGELDKFTLAGIRFALYRRGVQVQFLDLLGDERFVYALRTIIPKLNGRSTLSHIKDSLPDEFKTKGNEVIELLEKSCLLEFSQTPTMPWLDRYTETPKAVWLGHASVLMQFGEVKIWIDPLIFPLQHEAAEDEDTPPEISGIPECDALLITHGDNDHLSPSTLLRIDPDTSVVIPDCRNAGDWQVDMFALLKMFGFSNTEQTQPWNTLHFAETTVTAMPFLGEDWGLKLQTLTYLVEGPRSASNPESSVIKVFLAADSEGMDKLAKEISTEDKIDMAFVGVSGNAEAHVMPPEGGKTGNGNQRKFCVWLCSRWWELHQYGLLR